MVKSGKKSIYLNYQIRGEKIVINLIGTYECKVDAKGRLMVPAALKKQLLPILEEGFVLKRSVFQPCLELYPMAEWNVLMQKLTNLIDSRKRTMILSEDLQQE